MRASTELSVDRFLPEESEPARKEMGFFLPFLFLALHVPLALLMVQVPGASTVHALFTLAFAIIFCFSKRGFEFAGYFAAYIAGAEVLWRMTEASVFWEYGKYASVTVLAAAMILKGRIRFHPLAILYFALLIPSTIFVADKASWDYARQQISFNLSGPFSLMVAMCFFKQQQISRDQIRRLIVALIAPIPGIAAIAISSTLAAGAIQFGDESNIVTSGGYGPNQVSAVLGLGVLAGFFLLTDSYARKGIRFFIFIAMIVFATQSALTFSRGGLYLLVAGLIPAIIFIVRDPRARTRMILGAAVLVLLGWFVIFPALNSFTGGFLSVRFKDTSATGRSDIVRDDFRIWSEHFVLGTGPGLAKDYRKNFHRGALAHTEFTRLLAEHGLLGMIALILLACMGLVSIFRNRIPPGRAMAASLVAWSFLFMVVNAMRLVMPSFLFGLASAELFYDDESSDEIEDQE